MITVNVRVIRGRSYLSYRVRPSTRNVDKFRPRFYWCLACKVLGKMADAPKTEQMPENTQVKSKKRVADHGEVFTNPREVNAMLDLVKDETLRIDSRFLEPACGDGNFLIEILRRKMSVVGQRYAGTEWKKYALQAVASIYGIELLVDNAEQCRQRLYDFVVETQNVASIVKTCHDTSLQDGEFQKNVRYLLQRNIVQGDALTYTAADGKPIVFSEWTFVDDKVQRRDFQFDFLVKKEHQYSLFDENGDAQQFDEPVREFPLVHYTKIHTL